MPLFLTSLVFDGLNAWLDEHGTGADIAVIGNAGRLLDDGHAIVEMACGEIAAGGRRARVLDVIRDPADTLPDPDAVVLTGGDPFRLLADLRQRGALRGAQRGADQWLTRLHGRGIPIAGQSAGAMVCGPTLAPAKLTSPFPAPVDLQLEGLGLVPRLVLPHHGRPDRNAAHREAAMTCGGSVPLTALWDDEVLLIDETHWAIARDGSTTRRGRRKDAAAVAEIFHLAARQAWAPFLGAARLDAAPRDPAPWADRVTRSTFLVTEDAAGLTGFVYYHPAAEPGVGEVDVLYTHPRAWGSGIGRRLLERATWELLAAGYREAVLWTEARNERALAIYQANGWRPDGAVDEREYLDVPIRNLRHRLDLTRHGGG